jgi:hypothetical protein
MVPIRWAAIAGCAAVMLTTASEACGSTIWFDGTNGGQGYNSFSAMSSGYQSFVGPVSGLISFDNLPVGTHLTDQYSSLGVLFQNSAGGRYDGYSGIGVEGGGIVEDLTGYDGSYRPDGSNVYVKFDNNLPNTPFTLTFNQPVQAVSAFVGMGVEGPEHSLVVSLYDSNNTLLGQNTVQSWLWEATSAHQNYESFFAANLDTALISRVEILNLATTDFANALTIDDISWRSGGVSNAPEPTALMFLAVGGCALVIPRRRRGGLEKHTISFYHRIPKQENGQSPDGGFASVVSSY